MKQVSSALLLAAASFRTCCASEASLRGLEDKSTAPAEGLRPAVAVRAAAAGAAAAGVDQTSGELGGRFVLSKRFDLAANPAAEWVVEEHPDQNLTHSCANYVNDGSTVFSRDGGLVLKVSSVCEGGGCLNSGRVMSKEKFKYGLFTFTAKVPKCNYVWPALWLLPEDQNGEGAYGRWPCSGEIDVLETVHDQEFGTFNVVAGYGSTGGCYPDASAECNQCLAGYCTSTTMSALTTVDRYFIEDANCDAAHPSWTEHTWVFNWQPDELTTWIDPVLSYDSSGELVAIEPKPSPPEAKGMQTWKTYRRDATPTWLAVQDYMDRCFKGSQQDAPFDDGFKIVLNIAIGGYGGSPCLWGMDTCQTTCGGAVGSELVISDISVWERMS